MKLEQWQIGAILIVVILIIIGLFYFKKNKEGLENKKSESVIPLHIYQTWHTKKLPPKMRECVEKLKKDNPEFKHHLYDDKMCRKYIKDNYSKDILNAFDKLVPGAYKADLWRYCVLYKEGGIYMDIKFKCVKGFKLINLTHKEHFVLDRPFAKIINIAEELNIINNLNYYSSIYSNIDTGFWKNKHIGIYNALMVCKPKNSVLLECINTIVKNTKTNYYGHNPLYVTGPGLLGELYFKNNYDKIQDFELFNSLGGTCILNRKRVILKHYDEYRSEQNRNSKTSYYHEAWKNKKIYNNQ
jgi:hypothetical protein